MTSIYRLMADKGRLRMNLVSAIAAIAAGTGTSFIAAVPLGILTGFALSSLEVQQYADRAVILIQFPVIGIGILVGCNVFRRVKQRSAAAG